MHHHPQHEKGHRVLIATIYAVPAATEAATPAPAAETQPIMPAPAAEPKSPAMPGTAAAQ